MNGNEKLRMKENVFMSVTLLVKSLLQKKIHITTFAIGVVIAKVVQQANEILKSSQVK